MWGPIIAAAITAAASYGISKQQQAAQKRSALMGASRTVGEKKPFEMSKIFNTQPPGTNMMGDNRMKLSDLLSGEAPQAQGMDINQLLQLYAGR